MARCHRNNHALLRKKPGVRIIVGRDRQDCLDCLFRSRSWVPGRWLFFECPDSKRCPSGGNTYTPDDGGGGTIAAQSSHTLFSQRPSCPTDRRGSRVRPSSLSNLD